MYCINMMTCFWWASQSPACVDFYTTGKKPFSLLTFVIDGLCKKPYITFLYISVYILCKTFDANFITFQLIDRTKSEKFKRDLGVETVRWAVYQSAFMMESLGVQTVRRQFKRLSPPKQKFEKWRYYYTFLLNTLNFSPVPSALAQSYLTMSKNAKIQQITSFALSAREQVSFVKQTLRSRCKLNLSIFYIKLRYIFKKSIWQH